jgi:hypothetical protein
MTDSHDTTSEYSDDADPMATRLVRASSAPARTTAAVAQPESAMVTAELPIQRAPSGAVARRPAGPVMARRQPAPVGLQLVVWVLAFIFLVVLVGAILAAVSPGALTFMRHTTSIGIGPIASGARLLIG